jgi:hypothetical protein
MTHTTKLISALLFALFFLVLRLALSVEASNGKKHDDVEGRECQHQQPERNPHCQPSPTNTPSPTPTKKPKNYCHKDEHPTSSPTPSITLTLTPVLPLSPTVTIVPLSPSVTASPTPEPTITVSPTPLSTTAPTEPQTVHREVVHGDAVIWVYPGEDIERRGVAK